MDVSPYVASLAICGRCFEVRGPFEWWWKGVEHHYVQKCGCERDALVRGEPREAWMAFDFPTVVEICRCCGAEALRSGSRFSVWFCTPCRDRAVAFNAAAGQPAVPIGRHSIMSGIGLTAVPPAPGDLDRFVSRFRSSVGRMHHLDEWAHDITRRNLAEAGLAARGSVGVPEYLDAVADVDREQRFVEMLTWLAQEHVSQ